jgi:hypothetical protein
VHEESKRRDAESELKDVMAQMVSDASVGTTDRCTLVTDLQAELTRTQESSQLTERDQAKAFAAGFSLSTF